MRRGVRCASIVLALILPVSLFAADRDANLINAARQDNVGAVRELLKQGADVSAAAGDGTTALHWAARRDNLPMANLLLSAGAKVNAATDLGATPLFVACTNGSPGMVERLLKAGADPKIGVRGGGTPVMEASRTGNAAALKFLLDSGGDPNASESVRGQTALMWAAAEGHAGTAQLLLERGAKLDVRTHPTETPQATGAPAQPPARRRGGASNNGSNGLTALLFAVRVGSLDATRILLDAGADANDKGADNIDALTLATVRGQIQVAQLLLERGADPNAKGAGFTALHWATGSWESELTAVNITTERRGEYYYLPGLREGKAEFVKTLLEYGADPNVPMDKAPAKTGSSKNPSLPELKGATPLMLAAIAGRSDIMKILISAGANVKATTAEGANLVLAAAGLGRVIGEESELLVPENDTLAALKLAVESGADIRATDKAGNTALHYAALMRRNTHLEWLLDQGLDIHAKNKFDETPLWLSEVILEFAAGGLVSRETNSTGDLLRSRGAKPSAPSYATYRPTDWPDTPNPGNVGQQVPVPAKPPSQGQP